MAEIKEIIAYKSPTAPKLDISGQPMFSEDVWPKVDSKWEYNQLEEMKERSRSCQNNSPNRRR